MDEKTKSSHLANKTHNPFSGNGDFRSPTWCSLEWISNIGFNDSDYSSAFKTAADKIIAELERGESSEHPDPMFIPVAFLYRHSLELKMKSIIRKGIDLEEISQESDKLKEALENHNLHLIWNQFKSTIKSHWPESELTEFVEAEKFILQFHSIDKSGQHLRYAHDSSGDKTLNTYPKSIELGTLKTSFAYIYNILDCCDMDFDNCIATRNEMEAEYTNPD